MIREENTNEYKEFKKLSDEDYVLSSEIISLLGSLPDSVLDIGGRYGNVSRLLNPSANIVVVDPDTELRNNFPKDIVLMNEGIQNFDEDFSSKELIIASHVWGDIGRQGSQYEIFHKLLKGKGANSRLAIAHNISSGFLRELTFFAFNNLKSIRHDYFEESLLIGQSFDHATYSTKLSYSTYEDLAGACWVLFGTDYEDMDFVKKTFVPFLKKELQTPSFDFLQQLYIID